jgi:hypothetical protein
MGRAQVERSLQGKTSISRSGYIYVYFKCEKKKKKKKKKKKINLTLFGW